MFLQLSSRVKSFLEHFILSYIYYLHGCLLHAQRMLRDLTTDSYAQQPDPPLPARIID